MTHTVDFTFIADPGHGWLVVSMSDIAALGMTAASFTEYSFRKGDTLYLEEDCDCARFIDAYQAKYDHSPHISEKNVGSFDRSMSRLGA